MRNMRHRSVYERWSKSTPHFPRTLKEVRYNHAIFFTQGTLRQSTCSYHGLDFFLKTLSYKQPPSPTMDLLFSQQFPIQTDVIAMCCHKHRPRLFFKILFQSDLLFFRFPAIFRYDRYSRTFSLSLQAYFDIRLEKSRLG